MSPNDVYVLKGVDAGHLPIVEKALEKTRDVTMTGNKIATGPNASCFIATRLDQILRNLGYSHKDTVYHKRKMILKFEKE